MDTLKPVVDHDEAIGALEHDLGATISDFVEVAGGNVARTFSKERVLPLVG
jgi:hypothetical protein